MTIRLTGGDRCYIRKEEWQSKIWHKLSFRLLMMLKSEISICFHCDLLAICWSGLVREVSYQKTWHCQDTAGVTSAILVEVIYCNMSNISRLRSAQKYWSWEVFNISQSFCWSPKSSWWCDFRNVVPGDATELLSHQPRPWEASHCYNNCFHKMVAPPVLLLESAL